MKRILLLALIFVSFSAVSYAIDIPSTTIPCSEGGNITLSGTFDPLTGAVNVHTVATDCAFEDDATANGTADITGNVFPAGTSNVNVTVVFALTVVEDGRSATTNCTQTTVGTFDSANEVLVGTVNVTCSGSGEMSRDLLEVFFEVFPEMELK